MSYSRSLAVLALALSAVAMAAERTDWPAFHGPQRDNISPDTGLMQSWPQDGPELIWTATGIGHGYSSVSVAGGRIFTAGMVERKTCVTALDINGKELWQRINGQSWQATDQQPWAIPYSGSRGTPTVDDDIVYHLSEMGRLAAFDDRTGREIWYVDVLRTFDADRPKYGLSESVLIRGGTLFCCPGGKSGYIVALNSKTGQTVWANTEIEDPVGYCSPILADIDGFEQVISMTANRIFSVDPENGNTLWLYTFGNQRSNSATDVVVSEDGRIFASTGYGGGCVLLRPKRLPDGRFSVETIWRNELMDNHHGGVLLLKGRLYGAGHQSRGWFCLDLNTGDCLWQAPGKGSLTYADGRLYCLDEKGDMMLVNPFGEQWRQEGSFNVPSGGKGLYWAHPVVCGRRLYVRHADRLLAYNVGKD